MRNRYVVLNRKLIPPSVLALAAVLACSAGCTRRVEAEDRNDRKIDIAGDPPVSGFYDPSLQYSRDGETGWLVYSSVKGAERPFGPYVHTHLAKSADHGATWRYVLEVNTSSDALLHMPDGQSLPGVWRYEVPSLVYTPGDTGKEWKLFTHRYFWSPQGGSMFAYGWIAYRWASDPAGTWSQELPLFGAGQFPPAPYHVNRVDLNTFDSTLLDVVAYTEPGALYKDGTIYLTLTAARRDGPGQIVLIASADQGNTWTFVRTLLTRADARTFRYQYLDGSSLAEEDGRVFLFAVPGGRSLMHAGTWIFQFDNLAEGRLHRDSNGRLAITKRILPQAAILSGPGAGQSTYHRLNSGGGIVFPQFNLSAYPEVFQLFNTHQRIVDPGSTSENDPAN